MQNISIDQCYKLLNVSPSQSDEDITRSFKKLALKYHPDKNRNRVEWANQAMSKINYAYSTLMSYRFSSKQTDSASQQKKKEHRRAEEYRRQKEREKQYAEEAYEESLVNTFIQFRENCKDDLYKYFQYNLYNLTRRENPLNQSYFKGISKNLKKYFHKIRNLGNFTEDPEKIHHFNVFTDMIFNFYKASECLNILDSYGNILDVEAYRVYMKGEESLHLSHKEIFYDRHNRGKFYQELSVSKAYESKLYFEETIKRYPQSSWVVEADIKLNYVNSLIKYIDLFFNE